MVWMKEVFDLEHTIFVSLLKSLLKNYPLLQKRRYNCLSTCKKWIKIYLFVVRIHVVFLIWGRLQDCNMQWAFSILFYFNTFTMNFKLINSSIMMHANITTVFIGFNIPTLNYHSLFRTVTTQ